MAKTHLEDVALHVQMLSTKLILSVSKTEMVWNTLLYCLWEIHNSYNARAEQCD